MKFLSSCLAAALLPAVEPFTAKTRLSSPRQRAARECTLTCLDMSKYESPLQGVALPPPFRATASPPPPSSSGATQLAASAPPLESALEPAMEPAMEAATKKLGLLTFDLDDTLYPIAPVLEEANAAFSAAMSSYGFDQIRPEDIVDAGKLVRQEAGPRGTAMSHTEVRMEAIRRELQSSMLRKKLHECAQDWATELESLTDPIRKSADKWAKASVSESVVESIYSSWERERHHSAERHLYPEIIPLLQQIKSSHPNVIIGAVTDGKANPMLMVFSLAPFFDFCMSWEDDANGRTEFFKELTNVNGNADLQWIYNAAYEKYLQMDETSKQMRQDDEEEKEVVWIHVGDDLAYDVGGSASCGAKTILLDLDDEYGQTAKVRFVENGVTPSWSTASKEEIENRKTMNDIAEGMVNKRISRLSLLPDAIDDILNGK